ncbi:MAG: phosphoesterase [Sulfobacillus thermosulfidooxidans]|nr:CehA/McbA family metallohydrolase [Sulfobacillus thermotolerans]PSR32614.1 MAG: phosphoesterase [Sulfobacillus thermosulfidooxidans]
MIDPFHLFEYSVVLHVHSQYSDGTGTVADIIQAGQAAGVDIVILTDHDTLQPRHDRYGEGYYGRLLFLVGGEITPQQNHLLALFVDQLPNPDLPWGDIVQAVNRREGLSFVAHPVDQGSPFLKLPSYRWTERGVRTFTGIEVWNHLSSWLPSVTNTPTALRAILDPWWRIQGPDPAALQLWDELGQMQRVVGIAGVDAHAARVGGRRLGFTVFPYLVSFQTLRTQIYVPQPLTYHDLGFDQQLIYDALKEGRVALMACREGTEKGFRLWAQTSTHKWPMGSEVPWQSGLTLKATSPVLVSWRVWHNGMLAGDGVGLIGDWPITGPGVWRVELLRGRKQRPWLFSNPIYVREA